MGTKVVIGAEIKLENIDKAGQSVGSFRKQLKEAQQDVINMSDKFGLTSKEAANAAQKVALLRDRIGDAKQLADTFNPDKKFVALGGAVQGVVAGFSAFTGVMGLLGTESKEVEKLLLKVQSAMALQQGLSGLKSSIDSFKLLGQAIKASTAFQKANNIVTAIAAGVQRLFGVSVIGTGTAFNVLKGAIIATGIGALIVLIGVIISKMDMFSKKTESAAEATDRLKTATDALNKSVGEQIEFYDRINDLEIKRARIAGASEKEILDIQSKAVQRRIDIRNTEINAAIKNGLSISELAKGQLADENLLQDLKLDYQLKTAEKSRAAQKTQDDKDKAARDKRISEEKQARADFDKLAKEGLEKTKAEMIEYGEWLRAEEKRQQDAKIKGMYDQQEELFETKQALAELALLDDPDSIENKLLKNQADFDLEMLQFDGNNIQRQVKEREHADAILDIKKKHKDAEQLIEDEKLKYALFIAGQIADSLGTLADIAGRQTLAGKILAIAQTTINTIKGGIAAFTGMTQSIPGPVGIALGVVAAAGVVAAGVKAVKNIVAVKIPGQGGGNGAVPAIPLPAAPLTPQAQTTQLNQGSINAVGNAASRAYVLETDVSGNQERIRRLNRAARIN